MGQRAIACILVAATMLPLQARAADLDVVPSSKTEPQEQSAPASQSAPQPAQAGGQAFAPPDATCLEWTDGCRTCQKPAAGETSCSNVAIACVQQPPRCTRR